MANNITASRINKLRTSANLSQAAFGASINTTQAALSAYEKGIRTPSLDTLINISSMYNVSVDWLCGLCDTQNPTLEIKTYTDLIKLFIFLNDNNIFEINLNSESDVINGVLKNKTLMDFFTEWNEICSLSKELTNGEEFYHLWLEDAFKRYNVPISEN
jgi:transcriptional regulator with XRE-family HTH domain